jgi:hypothetical protein
MCRDIYPAAIDGYRIAKILNVSVEYLITGIDDNKQKQINKISILLEKAGAKLKNL